jgi:hypothetical protein
LHGNRLLSNQAKHCCGYHVFRRGVQDSPLELTARVGTMLVAVGDNSLEGVPDAARSAIHRAATVTERRRDRWRLCGRVQLLPNILKLFELRFA